MSFLNPFLGLIETKKYPHARTLRTTFWGKVWDTFKVFSGNLLPDKEDTTPYKKVHAGIFDYLTLGLHFLLSQLLILALRKMSSLAGIITGLIILLIINIPRLIFAAAFTLFCLPFAGIAHALSKTKGDKLKSEILAYTVKTEECIVFLASSALPHYNDFKHYKNNFFFVVESNTLFYIDFSGYAKKINMQNIEEFRKQYLPDSRVVKASIGYPFFFIKREIFASYLPESSPLDTYHSLDELLKIKNVDLQTITTIGMSNTEIKGAVNLAFNKNESSVVKFSIFGANPEDITFFKNITQLNIGSIQENIEETNRRIARQV